MGLIFMFMVFTAGIYVVAFIGAIAMWPLMLLVCLSPLVVVLGVLFAPWKIKVLLIELSLIFGYMWWVVHHG